MANTTSTEQQEPCRLLELPPELRLMIWEAYFSTNLIKEVAQHPHSRKKAVSLLSTCRTIFFEATPVYLRGLEEEHCALVAASKAVEAELIKDNASGLPKPSDAIRFYHNCNARLSIAVATRNVAELARDESVMFLRLMRKAIERKSRMLMQLVAKAKEKFTDGGVTEAN